MSDEPLRLGTAMAHLKQAQADIAAREDAAFHARLAELRAWQAHHVARLHAERAVAHNGQALLDFLTHRFYAEADWSELTGRPEAVASAIEQIVDRDRPLVIAIELQATTERLDMAVADALCTDDAPLTARRYVHALRAVDQYDVRRQQIAWLEELIDLVADYADNRAAYWGFKIARTPAHAVGIGKTYDLLAEGFAAMRAVTNLKPGVHDTIATQRARLERLLGRPLETT